MDGEGKSCTYSDIPRYVEFGKLDVQSQVIMAVDSSLSQQIHMCGAMEPLPKDKGVVYPSLGGPCCNPRVDSPSECYWQPGTRSSYKVTRKSLSLSSAAGLRSSNTTNSQILKPCGAQTENLEVQLTETCQRRFVMFDHSGRGKKIILHPMMASQLPDLFPGALNKQGEFLDHLQDVSFRAVNQLEETMISSLPLPIGAGLRGRVGWGHWSSGEEISSSLGGQYFGFTGGKDPALLSAKDASFSDITHRICSTETHENSDDIDALLNSDNEMSSTGHGPSNLTSNSLPATCRQGCLRNGSGKKRNFPSSRCCTEEEDDADSAMAMSRISFIDHSLEVSRDGLVTPGLSIKGLDSGYGKGKLWSLRSSCVADVSSSCSSNKQRRCSKKAKIQKIKSTFHMLQGIPPAGGESTDTAIVLDEAIRLVKSLHSEIITLEAKKLGR